MKKPKRPMDLYDRDLDDATDLEFGMENQDDDIIDLEDIVEMPVGAIDEDEDIEMDVEILDAEADLDFSLLEKEAAAGPKRAPKRDILDELTAPEAKSKTPEAKKPPGQLGKGVEDEDDLLEALIAAEKEKQAAEGVGGDLDEDSALASLEDEEIDEALFQQLMMEEPAPAKSLAKEPAPAQEPVPAKKPSPAEERPAVAKEPPKAPEQPMPVQPAPAPDSEPARAKVQAGASILEEMIKSTGDFQISARLNAHIDQLVGGVESKLVDTIREVVEARLPQIVREIIKEEIEELKKSLE